MRDSNIQDAIVHSESSAIVKRGFILSVSQSVSLGDGRTYSQIDVDSDNIKDMHFVCSFKCNNFSSNPFQTLFVIRSDSIVNLKTININGWEHRID